MSGHTRTPWRIDRDNAEGIDIVGDDGNLVFTVSYEGIPEERGAAFREAIVNEARANAYLVVKLVNRAALGEGARPCPGCGGQGKVYNSYDLRICEVCGGKGSIKVDARAALGGKEVK